MLDSNRKGYAVMSEDLKGYSFEDESLETCKRYCRKGYVIVEQIPYKCGFSISIIWRKWYKPFDLHYNEKNIFWLHWRISYNYLHRTGKTVYTPKES